MLSGKPFNYSGTYYRRIAENVPALEEPFMTNPMTTSKLAINLQTIKFPRNILWKIIKSEKAALWKDEDFGLSLKGYSNGSVKKAVPDVVAKESNKKKKWWLSMIIYEKIWSGMATTTIGQAKASTMFSVKKQEIVLISTSCCA
ncbi:MAG: hypothetical protein R3E32_14050 [Chitinophagales bacterium]